MKKSIASVFVLILILTMCIPAFAHSTDDFILGDDEAVLFFGRVLEYNHYYEEEVSLGGRRRWFRGYIEVEITDVLYGDVNNLTLADNGTGVMVTLEEGKSGETVVKRKNVSDMVEPAMKVGNTYFFIYSGNNGDIIGVETTTQDWMTLDVLNCEDTHLCFLEEALNAGTYEIAEQERLDRLYMATAESTNVATSEVPETEAVFPEGEQITEDTSVNSSETEALPYENVESVDSVQTGEFDGAKEQKTKVNIGYIAGGVTTVAIIAVGAVVLLKKR